MAADTTQTPRPTTCPRCQHPSLARGEAGGRTVDACAACHGVWLNPADAAVLLAPLADASNKDPRGSSIACPLCASSMETLAVAGGSVTIDRCGPHGTWFDAQEIDTIAASVAVKRDGVPPPRLAPATALTGAALAVATAVVAVDASATPERAVSGHGGFDAADVLIHLPDAAALSVETSAAAVEAAGHAVGLAGDAVAGAADIADALPDVAEAASSGFEVIFEVVGGIFEALGSL